MMKKAESSAYEVPSTATSRHNVHQPQYAGNMPVHTTAEVDEYNGRIIRQRPLVLKGYRHLFDPWTSFRLKDLSGPHFYRKAGYAYEHLSRHWHIDCLNREYVGDNDDRYISPFDGKIKRLIIQSTDEIYDNTLNSTWRRTFIRNISPLYLRLANWPFSHVDYKHGPESGDWPLIILKWIGASIAITFVVGTPNPGAGQARNPGCYDTFPYRYNAYPKVARNLLENENMRGRHINEANPTAERILRPKYLCFLREHGQPAMLMNVEEWITEYNAERTLSYIFVAYTAEQFRTTEDMIALHQIAEAAARNARVPAYWIGCSCMPEPQNLEEDVYRICDVIRGAHSLVIAVARPPNDINEYTTTDQMLQQWGRRIWTFPEVLLSPARSDIKVYTRGSDLSAPIDLAKSQFAARVWKDDAHVSRQLIDHYEGNLILNQLELVTLALECLQNRQTTEHLPGDHSYALMGLLRVRPKVDRTDTAFQAFARLSLANDSNQLLERLISVQPRSPTQPWHTMDDAYNSKLWDILPNDTVNIAGIGEDDTIILDGCRAANIRWKKFAPVTSKTITSWKRLIAQRMLHSGGYVFFLACVILAFSLVSPIARAIGVIFLIYSLILMGLSPWLLRMLYLGKFWNTQPWFFGFEGKLDIDTIEAQIFGARLGRLSWSAFGSPLMRHRRDEHGQCVAEDPTTDPAVRELVEAAKRSAVGELKIFTLVDTATMTVTLFQAARPPVAIIIAASEGGMQRGIGCSYDWTTQTLYRETVLRLETPSLDIMGLIPRAKIGFKRPVVPVRSVAEGGVEGRGDYVV